MLACFGDPGLDAARVVASGPVVISEARMKMATYLGRGFSVVMTSGRTVGSCLEVQEAMAASRIAELDQSTLAEGESAAYLRADESAVESYDADKSAEHSSAFVHLNQLAVEHAFGGR